MGSFIEEEILRIKTEQPDDDKAVPNNRVKGQLKVTRAFSAGFLKKPACNEALLEMFRIDYVGNAPYLSCIPSVVHHHLSSSDRFLVLSSDRLYQYFNNEEVTAMFKRHLMVAVFWLAVANWKYASGVYETVLNGCIFGLKYFFIALNFITLVWIRLENLPK